MISAKEKCSLAGLDRFEAFRVHGKSRRCHQENWEQEQKCLYICFSVNVVRQAERIWNTLSSADMSWPVLSGLHVRPQLSSQLDTRYKSYVSLQFPCIILWYLCVVGISVRTLLLAL